MFAALEGREHRCEYPGVGEVVDGVTYDGLTPRYTADGKYCCATVTHKATLGYIVECLHKFHDQPATLIMPQIAPGSFEKKLYSMYLSYLPADKVAFDLKMNCDARVLHRTCQNSGPRPVLRKHFKTRHHQGPALAQFQVGILYRGFRPRADSGAEDRDG